MKLFHGLTWTLFQVCWALEGPGTVTAPLGGSLSVQCQYGKDDKRSVKYWCKEESSTLCSSSHTVRTTRTEAEVKSGRMSIKDNHAFHKFIVTMENLTNEDAGTYICGVERTYNIWHTVEVIITDSVTLTHFGSMEQATEKPAVSPVSPERAQPSNTDFLLLVIWKIPVFLAMMAAVVWVHVWYRRTRRNSNPKAPETEEALEAEELSLS